jgi:hypothetical protein
LCRRDIDYYNNNLILPSGKNLEATSQKNEYDEVKKELEEENRLTRRSERRYDQVERRKER